MREHFSVAFSYAGEQRALIEPVAKILQTRLVDMEMGTVFYDRDQLSHTGQPDGDSVLAEVYRSADLVVVGVSSEYGSKEWPKFEWEIIRSRRFNKDNTQAQSNETIFPLRVGDGAVVGLEANAIVHDIRNLPADRVVQMLIDRLKRIMTGMRPDIKNMFSNENRQVFAVVGMGFSGTITAIRLMELSRESLNIALFESDEDNFAGGLAYSSNNTGWEHLLNIQAGRISAYRERPTDFIDWCNELTETEKSDWAAPYKSQEFKPTSAVPRILYGRYLKSRLTEATKQGKHEAVRCNASVTSIRERLHHVELKYQSKSGSGKLLASCVYLATGHREPTILPQCIPIKSDQRFIASPYSRRLRAELDTIAKSRKILILGTGLSAYDACISLTAHGVSSGITMVSRNGLTHTPYPADHLHDIVAIPQPMVPAKGMTGIEMTARLNNELQIGIEFLKETNRDISPDVIKERVLKALEPWVAVWMQSAESEQVKEFLDAGKSLLTTIRTGIVPEVGHRIVELQRQGAIELLRACQ